MYTQKIANKFLENKSRQIFLRSTGLLYKFLQQIWGCLNQPFIIFIHHIWGETVLFIIQSSDRIRYLTIFQDKLHSDNIQDEPNRSKISENFQNHPYGQLVLVSIVRAVSVVEWFEWTLTELRFNIIANLLLFVLLFNGFSYNDV